MFVTIYRTFDYPTGMAKKPIFTGMPNGSEYAGVRQDRIAKIRFVPNQRLFLSCVTIGSTEDADCVATMPVGTGDFVSALKVGSEYAGDFQCRTAYATKSPERAEPKRD